MAYGLWKPSNSPYWHYDFQVGKRRFAKSTKCANRKDALAVAKARKAEEQRKKAKAGVAYERDMALLPAIERYMAEHGRHGVATDGLERAFDWLLEQVGETVRLSEIDDEMIAKLISKRRAEFKWGNAEKGLMANATVNASVLSVVQRLLTRARTFWKIYLPEEPNYKIHRLEEPPRVKEMTVRQEIAIQSACGDTGYWDVVQFYLYSGLRKSEGILEWSQVDFEQRVIRVTAKFNKPHEVRITPSIMRLLRRAEGKHPRFVWTYRMSKSEKSAEYLTDNYYPVTKSGFSGAWKWIRKSAGLGDLRIHDLRKTAGARLQRATGDLVAVQQLLGHANIGVTRKHYIHITHVDVEKRMLAAEAMYAKLKSEVLAGRPPAAE